MPEPTKIYPPGLASEGPKLDRGSLTPAYGVWPNLWRLMGEIKESVFMAEMISHMEGPKGHGLIDVIDCATLYGLTRWRRPMVVVESGGYLGMSSTFILKALADEGLDEAKLYSLESDPDCDHGALIPDELRSRFVPLSGKVEDFLGRSELPSQIDMFFHDSSHRYRHMLWEFRQFWKRLGDGGLLVSHDVHFNAAFAEFVASTQAHDRSGLPDWRATTNYEWGRWGYVGFIIKKAV